VEEEVEELPSHSFVAPDNSTDVAPPSRPISSDSFVAHNQASVENEAATQQAPANLCALVSLPMINVLGNGSNTVYCASQGDPSLDDVSLGTCDTLELCCPDNLSYHVDLEDGFSEGKVSGSLPSDPEQTGNHGQC